MPAVVFMPSDLKETLLASIRRLPSGGDQFDIGAAAAELEPSLEVWWNLYADRGRLHPRLQYYYVLREALDDLRRRLFEIVTYSASGVSDSNSDIVKALAAMRADTTNDIAVLEKSVNAGMAPAVATMTATQINETRPGCINPGDSRYTGDPNKRTSWPIR